MTVERYADVNIEQVFEEAKKHEIQLLSLFSRLGESDAAAGEPERRGGAWGHVAPRVALSATPGEVII